MPYDAFKHHRRSIRLHGYDYSQMGTYFLTICVKNRECIFGDIMDGEMRQNQFGEIVLKWWNELPNYYPPIQLDEFVVMPNHLHGIVVITNVGAGLPRPNIDPPRADEWDNTGQGGIGQHDTGRDEIGRGDPAPTEKRTLGQLVGYFKFQITKEINQIQNMNYAKLFQRDYYEHIIRNECEWNVIAEYIRNNPANWDADLDNPRNFSKRPPPKTSDEYWNHVVGAGSPRPALDRPALDDPTSGGTTP